MNGWTNLIKRHFIISSPMLPWTLYGQYYATITPVCGSAPRQFPITLMPLKKEGAQIFTVTLWDFIKNPFQRSGGSYNSKWGTTPYLCKWFWNKIFKAHILLVIKHISGEETIMKLMFKCRWLTSSSGNKSGNWLMWLMLRNLSENSILVQTLTFLNLAAMLFCHN